MLVHPGDSHVRKLWQLPWGIPSGSWGQKENTIEAPLTEYFTAQVSPFPQAVC